MRQIIVAAATALLIIGLAGCAAGGDERRGHGGSFESEPLSSEEQARSIAIGMDSVFADDETWEAALDVAQSYCDIAKSSDNETALLIMSAQALDNGVSGEQVGIMAGIGQNLYCPEVE